MTEKESVEQAIRAALAEETTAIALSEKLFSPGGLFSRLATSDEERRALVRGPLFKAAQQRFRELQLRDGQAFSKMVPKVPDGCIVKIEKA